MSKIAGYLDFMPGLKTACGILAMAGMLVCEGFGWHKFSMDEWKAAELWTGYGIAMKVERKWKA